MTFRHRRGSRLRYASRTLVVSQFNKSVIFVLPSSIATLRTSRRNSGLPSLNPGKISSQLNGLPSRFSYISTRWVEGTIQLLAMRRIVDLLPRKLHNSSPCPATLPSRDWMEKIISLLRLPLYKRNSSL